jgi:hypothetical protein
MSKAIVNPILRVLIPAASVAAAGAAVAGDIPLPAATPVFGLSTAPDGSFLVSDVGSGVLEVRKGGSSPVASLPGATDVAAIGRGVMFAITSEGFGGDGRLYRVSRGGMREIADLLAFEEEENPDGGIIESNPFNVAVDNGGRTRWVTARGGIGAGTTMQDAPALPALRNGGPWILVPPAERMRHFEVAFGLMLDPADFRTRPIPIDRFPGTIRIER